MLMNSHLRIKSITNKFPYEITTKKRTHHDLINFQHEFIIKKRNISQSDLTICVASSISTPKYGKISCSKDEKRRMER